MRVVEDLVAGIGELLAATLLLGEKRVFIGCVLPRDERRDTTWPTTLRELADPTCTFLLLCLYSKLTLYVTGRVNTA